MRFTFGLNGCLTSMLRAQSQNLHKVNAEHKADLKVKLGLEIHARILSQTKIFS